jgi:hypothetical protein
MEITKGNYGDKSTYTNLEGVNVGDKFMCWERMIL